MFYVLCILSVIVNSFWRRWFGGGYKNTWLGNNRAVQCTIYLLYTSALAYYLSRFSEVWYNAIFAAIFACFAAFSLAFCAARSARFLN